MDEDTIFGPLTLRQFLYIGVGLIAAYGIHVLWPTPTGYMLILLIAGVVVAGILNHPRVQIDAEYLLKKKSNSKNPEAYRRWLKMKIAMLQSHAMMREGKRLPADPKNEALRQLLEAELAKEGDKPLSTF
ncbi:MAG: hypothetical protein RL150_162 [Candidatus Parcubacteria bacterium]